MVSRISLFSDYVRLDLAAEERFYAHQEMCRNLARTCRRNEFRSLLVIAPDAGTRFPLGEIIKPLLEPDPIANLKLALVARNPLAYESYRAEATSPLAIKVNVFSAQAPALEWLLAPVKPSD